MKKIRNLCILVCGILLLSGCGKEEKELVTKCKLNSKNAAQNYELKSEYEIHSTNDEVSSVTTKEVVISDSSEIIEYFKTYLTQTYSATNETYGGYDNKVTVDGNTLTSTTVIDYDKMDLDQYVKDNTAMKSYVNDNNKLTLEGVKSVYEAMGAECE